MRRPEGEYAELWVSDIQRLFGIEPRVVQEYWSKENRIVRPASTAIGQGGRNVYRAKEIVKLLVAKQLAESGMKLEEVQKVIGWMETKTVKLVRYPHDPRDLQRFIDTGEYKWTSGDPRGEEPGWWEAVTFDPFPDSELAATYYAKLRGYSETPTSGFEWQNYWGEVAQFVLIDRYRTGLTSLQVLIPLRWLHSQEGRFIRIHDWFNRVVGDLAFEPVLRWGHDPLSTIRIIDVAMFKRLVADRLLNPPEEEGEVTDE